MDVLFDNGRQAVLRVDESVPTGLTVRVYMAIIGGGGRPAIATDPSWNNPR